MRKFFVCMLIVAQFVVSMVTTCAKSDYGQFETLDELLMHWQDTGAAGLNGAYNFAMATHKEGQDYILKYEGYLYHLTDEEMQDVKRWMDGDYDAMQDESGSNSAISEIVERQNRFSAHYKYLAEQRLKEYWEVSMTGFVLACEEDSEAVKIITMHMKWDVENGVEQTRKMLTMYSDDMAAYLKESDPDTTINNICIIWEAPYILKKGPVAKYEYYDAGTYMMHSKSSGYLYTD